MCIFRVWKPSLFSVVILVTLAGFFFFFFLNLCVSDYLHKKCVTRRALDDANLCKSHSGRYLSVYLVRGGWCSRCQQRGERERETERERCDALGWKRIRDDGGLGWRHKYLGDYLVHERWNLRYGTRGTPTPTYVEMWGTVYIHVYILW